MPISQKPKQLFDLNIEDEIVRRNFEALNKELQKRLALQELPPPNIALSSGEYLGSYGGSLNTYYRPPGLAATITTRGNPVELELLPSESRRNLNFGGLASIVATRSSGGSLITFYVGLFRTTIEGPSAGVTETRLYEQTISVVGRNLFGALYSFTLPTWNFQYLDTKVGAGKYKYQFFVHTSDANTTIAMDNLVLKAQEIR